MDTTKIHWRIRLDAWMGHMLVKISRGRLHNQVINWFDKKYPYV